MNGNRVYESRQRRWLPALALGLLTACSSGGDGEGGGGGGGGGGGNPGNGGGPNVPGPQGDPLAVALDFEAHNDRSEERTETLRVSVPFPKGGYTSTADLIVSGHQTAWMPMQFWPDGTIKMAQAQFTDTLGPDETKSYTIARNETALTGAFTRNTWVEQAGQSLEFGAEVRDTFSVNYVGMATGQAEVLQETPLVRVQRWRTYHQPQSSPNIGRDYLTSTFYATEFRDMPFMLVDWIIGNDYLGADNPNGSSDPNMYPLGCVDVKRARFLCKGMSGIQPYRANKNGMGSELNHGNGFVAFQVMTDTFLDDAQTRRYRFLLRFEPNGANPADVARWQAVADAMLEDPIYPLATQQTWEETEAAGLLGGPISGPNDARSRAVGEYNSWKNSSHFGTWGTRSDVKATATTGTPRNHPMSPELAHAIQGMYPRLLQKLESMAWIQACRPYHLYGLTVGAEQRLLLWDCPPVYPGSRDLSHESLGRRAIVDNDPWPQYRTANQGQSRAHGWEQYDHEHWSMDLMFDYWTISGDAWAKEEIRQMGECCKAVMRLRDYYTVNVQAARAEGWTMQAMAQSYQATQDPAMKSYALRRVNEIVDPGREKNHASRAIVFQSNYLGTGYPYDHEFFMPWQHGALLYGYLGAYRSFDEPILLEICEDVVPLLDYSWMTNVQTNNFGFVANGLRYYVPVSHNNTPIAANYWDSTVGIKWGDSPLGGAHQFLIGGLFHLAIHSQDQAVQTGALHYGNILLGNVSGSSRWGKWRYCVPAFYAQ